MKEGSFFKFHVDLEKGAIGIGDVNVNLYVIAANIAKILGIIVLMYVVIKVGSLIIDKTAEKQSTLRFSLGDKKSKTFGAVLKSILRYAVYFFGVTGIFTILFGNISLTFASIGGVAIGFGAQNLVKDIINGFFILFEDQFSVGEYINIEDKAGIVESIELRVTKLKDFNGDLHIIPNGLITRVTNHSRGEMRVLVDVDIAFEEDIDNAIGVLNEVCENFKKNEPNMVEGPGVLGVTAFKESGVTIRIIGKAKPMTQWGCETNLRREVKKAFQKAEIEIPYPKRHIIKEG